MQLHEYLCVESNYIRSLQRDPKTGDYTVNVRGKPGALHVSSKEIIQHKLIWKSYELRPLGK